MIYSLCLHVLIKIVARTPIVSRSLPFPICFYICFSRSLVHSLIICLTIMHLARIVYFWVDTMAWCNCSATMTKCVLFYSFAVESNNSRDISTVILTSLLNYQYYFFLFPYLSSHDALLTVLFFFSLSLAITRVCHDSSLVYTMQIPLLILWTLGLAVY